MQIPSLIQTKLTETYDGIAAARFTNSMEAKNFESELEQYKLSYRTRIVKSRKYGRSFIVMVLETPQWH